MKHGKIYFNALNEDWNYGNAYYKLQEEQYNQQEVTGSESPTNVKRKVLLEKPKPEETLRLRDPDGNITNLEQVCHPSEFMAKLQSRDTKMSKICTEAHLGKF